MTPPTVDIDVLLAAMGPAAVVIDADGRIISANDPARRLLGLDQTGRHYSRTLRNPAMVAAIEQTLAGTPPEEPVRWRPGGTQMSIEAQFGGWGRGEARAALVVLSDRTAAEQADAMRRDFIANVSHELRTPLTSLLGFAETLQGAARDDPRARDRFLSIMSDEALRMKRLVDDLLSLSAVEESERQRPTGQVDLTPMAAGVWQALAPLAAEAQVTLGALPEMPVPRIPGDADQLRQVLTNLVENAIRYAGAAAHVRLEPGPPQADALLGCDAITLTVADDGAGIDPLHIPRLTERFYRADDHRDRARGGTGLGLAIVKHIVNRHRGRLQVQSAPGEGSRFAVVLPV